MIWKMLKKTISLALAVILMLLLSCCGEGDEIQIEESTLTITDEETILASLTDEEMAVWETMPYIITMRMLERFDDNDDELLSTEIVYIDKIGRVKKFISYDECGLSDNDTIEWLNNQISQNKDAEIVNTADIHTLIEYYNTFMRIDKDSEFDQRYLVEVSWYIERHYWFKIYGIRDDNENGFEILNISFGDAGNPYIRFKNLDIRYTYNHKDEPLDTLGGETLDLYLQLDPFMVLCGGNMGYLTGEEG